MNRPVKSLQEASPVEDLRVKRRRAPTAFAWVVILASLLLAGGWWWHRQQNASQPAAGGRNAAPMSIVPETVGKGDMGIKLNALGTVTSLATVTVRTQISGYLIKIDFTEGQEVKKGDLLAEIDSRP